MEMRMYIVHVHVYAAVLMGLQLVKHWTVHVYICMCINSIIL